VTSDPRVAVIGDLAGHRDELRDELIRLGADASTLRLPPDLTVVQVGDLVHRGPDSPGVVALVDRYLREQPRQWVQLVGNHEAQYLRAPAFSWPEVLAEAAVATLRSWWADGRMRVAAGAHTVDGEEFLITHAGLTEAFWQAALDGLPTAAQCAGALNSFIGRHDDVLFAIGHHLGGGAPNFAAGPVWAGAAGELIPSWQASGAPMPFSQIHGHSTVIDWQRRRLYGEAAVAAVMTFDEVAAHETATLPGGRIIGIDPRHARAPHHPWRALELTGSLLA
jgi:hypothetical protein